MADNGLYIRDSGEGRPLILLHGWSCPGQFFDEQVAALSPHARCIVPDLPGHGETADGLPLSVEAAADAVHAFLEAERLSGAILCGWSMGALVAYSVIERHGADRIAGLVSIDMSPKVLNDNQWKNGTASGLTAEVNELLLAGILSHWDQMPGKVAGQLFAADSPVDEALVAWAAAEITKGDPALLQPMWASLCAQDFRALLKTFSIPFHLVCGRQSQLYGAGVRQWHADNVPGAEIHAFEKSGHAPHLEEPDAFNRLLRGIIER